MRAAGILVVVILMGINHTINDNLVHSVGEHGNCRGT